jgi:hypothetical protein
MNGFPAIRIILYLALALTSVLTGMAAPAAEGDKPVVAGESIVAEQPTSSITTATVDQPGDELKTDATASSDGTDDPVATKAPATADGDGQVAATDEAEPSGSEDSANAGGSAEDTAPEEPNTTDTTGAAAAAGVSLATVMTMLQKQQAELDSQRAQIAKQKEELARQSALIVALQAERDKVTSQEKQITAQTEQIDSQSKSIQALQAQVDQIAAVDPMKLSEEQVKNREKLQTLEASLQASEQASSTTYDIDSFPGSIPIPGTAAAIQIGGFVKMNIVESLSPIGSPDRFIVGSIPVPQEKSKASAAITVDQSRLNFDLREQTSVGPLRAFIEGDFAGNGTSFRLRHAYGQYKSILAGQTWSTFMDNEASPEELDFEGINGRINVRQPEIRYFPEIGQDWNFLVAFENPDAQVTNGEGLSQWPDFVASIRRTWFERFHVKTALILRNIEAEWDDTTNGVTDDSAHGWGLTVSGKTAIPRLGDTRDNFLFQFNYGEGYGRYINDLGTIGDETGDGFDAIFDQSGNLSAFPVWSYYVAIQKWWGDTLRSNFNYSFVNVDNFDFQPDDAYDATQRASGNIIWSPSPRIDLGTELLYGTRKNKDGQKADATQIQISAKYRY